MIKVIFIIGSIQAFFLGILLLKKKSKKVNEKILPIWFFLLGLHLLLIFVISFGTFNSIVFLTILHITFPLIHFPLLFLYVNELIRNTEKFRFKNLLVFIPFFAFLTLQFFFTKPSSLSKYDVMKLTLPPGGFVHFNLIINIVYGLVCTIMCLIQLRKFNKRIKDYVSNINEVNLKWLAHLILGFVSILFVAVVYILFIRIFYWEIPYNIDLFIYGSITIFIFSIGYYSIKKTHLINNKLSLLLVDMAEPGSLEPKKTKKEKYEVYGLKKNEALLLKNKLLKLMNEKKPYLDSELSLTQLAETLGTYKHYVTQVLNDELNQNFYDFINSYRIEEVKRLMKGSEFSNYKIYALALEAGFNSKSAFNRIFKNITGLTPSQYKNQNN